MNGISVIIPYYNRMDYFKDMLDSLLGLVVKPDEIILVNNNASSQMVAMAEQFKSKMAEICNVILMDCISPGACAARNAGLNRASSDFVYFFDSDDIMSADFIERVKKEISRQELDMYVFFTTIRKNDGSTHVRNYGASKYPWYQIITPFLTTQSVVVRKMYFQQTGGWDESLHYWNDWELGVRLLTNKPQMLYFQDKSYHIIHSHPNSITGRSLSERFDEINIAIDKVYHDIQDRKSINALYFRKSIIAGKIKAEGNGLLGMRLKKKSYPEKQSTLNRIISFALYHYSALGLPGAWRIAAKILSC